MSTPASPPPALAGVRVLEFGPRTACRVCGTLLAQFGADVVSVESPAARSGEPRRAMLLAGKRSFCAQPPDRGRLEGLLAGSDLVIGSSDDPDISPALQSALAGGAIVIDICSRIEEQCGAEPLDDLAVQALSGMMETTGMPDGPPCPVDGEPLEMIAALHGLAGALAALHARRRDGHGQRVRVSLIDCAISSHAVFVSKLAELPDAPALRTGNRHLLASPWNVFRASDGWLLVCMASERQWQRACELMGDPDLAFREGYDSGTARQQNLDAVEAVVQRWVGSMDVATVSRVLLDAGIPCGAVAPVDGYPREANLEHRAMIVEVQRPGGAGPIYLCASPLRTSDSGAGPPPRIPLPDGDRDWVEGEPWSPREARPATPGNTAPPLAGIRVLELGHYTTAPLTSRYLANLGAEVIKVEPPGGEPMRPWMPQRHGLGTFFIVNNTGKRSVVLDLKSPRGLAALESLLGSADVLVENLKPGALARMGLPFERMRSLNPQLIYCAISGFGVDSVYPGRPAYDTVIQAMSGLMDRIRSQGQPVKAGMSSADAMGANFSVAAIIAALLHREHSGRGQFIDVSMQDVAAWSVQLGWNGAPSVQSRCSVCPVSDGHVLISPADDAVAAAAAGLTRAECERRWPGRVWSVNTLNESMRSPLTGSQLLEVADEQGRSWPVLRNPINLSHTPLVHAPIGADLGADNDRLIVT